MKYGKATDEDHELAKNFGKECFRARMLEQVDTGEPVTAKEVGRSIGMATGYRQIEKGKYPRISLPRAVAIAKRFPDRACELAVAAGFPIQIETETEDATEE